MYTVKRGRANISIIDGVTKGKDVISASNTQNLINAILTLMNERDSIKYILDHPTEMGLKLYSGIKDTAKEAELKDVLSRTNPNQPIYASDINTVIKYTNELSTTFSKASYSLKEAPCNYARENVLIHRNDPEPLPPDRQDVDPVTGEGIFNPDGTPKMVPGFRNPVPVLDADGNPTYYTVTKAPILVEGPPLLTPDIEQTVRICENPSIQCDNRSTLTGWARSDMVSGNMVHICTRPMRMQMVLEQSSVGGGGAHVDNVNKGDLIKAETFTQIAKNLRSVSETIGDYHRAITGNDGWDGGDAGCALACQAACMTTCQSTCMSICMSSCQTACMISCMSCFSGTCHNQNCGGWS